MDIIGQTLGQYRIVEPIGAGGMATVYKAYQPGLDRYVAIKVLPAQHALTPGFKERFLHEAKAVAQLSHPNILPIYDVGLENDLSYFVMKYVPGYTLRHLIGGVMPFLKVNRYVTQIAGALDHAHRRGILHRDIKPANVLLDEEEDWLLLADFGLAKIVGGNVALTDTGAILGTPAYASPEQVEGRPVDQRTDIYALGIVLYEMVTGQVPYQADTPISVMFKHIHEPLPSPRQFRPDIPEEVEQIIFKATAKAKTDRYSTVTEMADALQQAVDKTMAGTRPEPQDDKGNELELTLPHQPIATPLPQADSSTYKIASPAEQSSPTSHQFHPGFQKRLASPRAISLIAVAAIIVLLLWGGSRLILDKPTTSPPASSDGIAVNKVATSTSTPASTSTPTLTTAPTATLTPSQTPTPGKISGSAIVIRALDVHEGPGNVYSIFENLKVNTVVEVVGRNKKGTWWQIIHPSGLDGRGWIDADNAEIDKIDSNGLPIIAVSPPTATATPTHTSIPSITPVPTSTPTSTFTPSPTRILPSPTPTPSSPPSPTPTPEREFVRNTAGYQMLIRNFGGRPTASESFSSTGQRIVITEGAKLYTINRDGGDSHIWMEEDETIRPVEMAVWSPDGQLIAFAADRKQNCYPSCRMIGVLQIASGSITFLEAPPGQIIDLPRWIVDGRLLVIIHSGDPANGTPYVFSQSGDGAIASGTYELSSSHEGQKWFPWQSGKTWAVRSDRPDSYYYDD